MIKNSAYKKQLFAGITKYVEKKYKLAAVRYIRLGYQVIRVLCYAQEILLQMGKQLTYTMSETAKNYDATIIAWQEQDIRHFLGEINEQFDLRKNMRLRLDMLLCRQFYIRIRENTHINSTLVEVDEHAEHIRAYNEDAKTYYVAWRTTTAENLMQDGHLFVQQLYHICNTPTRHLVHGAVVGINGNGVLFCARGGRGKSTLTVKALLDGFEYVSDDYLLLDKTKDDKLTASPIYSIITLSPKMHSLMADEFAGEFIAKNARGDKSVFNIAAYHKQFKSNYPLNMLMFPQIVADNGPNIKPMHKGRAVTQLIHSTITQTDDIYNTSTLRKLLGFLKDLPCYQIDLSSDIAENTRCLRQFLTVFEKDIKNGKLCAK